MTATLGLVKVHVKFSGEYETWVDQGFVVPGEAHYNTIDSATCEVAEDEIQAVVHGSGLENARVIILGSEIVS
jgi:hypothetical protein